MDENNFTAFYLEFKEDYIIIIYIVIKLFLLVLFLTQFLSLSITKNTF